MIYGTSAFQVPVAAAPGPWTKTEFLKVHSPHRFSPIFFIFYIDKKVLRRIWVLLLKAKGYPTFLNRIKDLGELGTTCTRKSASW